MFHHIVTDLVGLTLDNEEPTMTFVAVCCPLVADGKKKDLKAH